MPEATFIPAPVILTVWSGALFVIVALLAVPAKVMPVPAVRVTSVPLELFTVSGEEVPDIERSVPLPDVAAMVTMPSAPVPVVVRVTFAPSTS